MYSMSIKEVEKDCRRLARECGATFKVDNNLKINNNRAYYFINRKTKIVILENCTLGSAYDNLLSGYVKSLIN